MEARGSQWSFSQSLQKQKKPKPTKNGAVHIEAITAGTFEQLSPYLTEKHTIITFLMI